MNIIEINPTEGGDSAKTLSTQESCNSQDAEEQSEGVRFEELMKRKEIREEELNDMQKLKKSSIGAFTQRLSNMKNKCSEAARQLENHKIPL